MIDQGNMILAYWNEHRQQLRQSESQRSTITNFILVITAGLTGLIVQQQFSSATIPLGILITLIGLYGAVTTAKYHERASYHLSQARALTATLREIGALPDEPRIAEFRKIHYATYPRLHRIRLHWLWTGLQLSISVYGGALSAISILS
ncbi:hypothetical protein [Micromonospora arborensis]|uniref:hypothetical protein n=1 Tax=Micromonospora arborensis TaxID=2116518 RepID=UPI003724C209